MSYGMLTSSVRGAQVGRDGESPRNEAKHNPEPQSHLAAGGHASGLTEETAAIDKQKNLEIINDGVDLVAEGHHEHPNEDEMSKVHEAAITSLRLGARRPSEARCRGHFVSNSQDSNNKDTLPLQTVDKELDTGRASEDNANPEPVSFRTSQLSSTHQSLVGNDEVSRN